jgi:ABC-2 type transport system permease protein
MRTLGKVGAIGVVNLRRFARDRLNLFFVFVFPIAMVLVIGLQFGSGSEHPRLGLVGVGGTTEDAILTILEEEDDIEIVRVDDVDELDDRVASTDLDAGMVVPPDADDDLAAGRPVEIEVLAGTTEQGQQAQLAMQDAVQRVGASPTAAADAVARGADPDDAAVAAQTLSGSLDAISVETVTTGEQLFPDDLGQYDVAAPGLLVLFVFVNGLTGAYSLIQTRQMGVSRRMMSTPTSVGTIISGEAFGRWLLAMVQGLYILLATMLLFGMGWGDPLGAAAVLVMVSAVAAGAAMVFGTVFSDPDQASGIGVVVALIFGALGGAMLPIELFGDTMASLARVAPHYWAIDAFSELVRHDGSLVDIFPQLGVLAAMSAGLLALASWRMRVVLSRGG